MSQLAFTVRPSTSGLRLSRTTSVGLRAAAGKPKSWNPTERTFEAILASETPCREMRITSDWRYVEVEEVLPMSGLKDIASLRGRPLLNCHNSRRAEDVLGTIEDAWVVGAFLHVRLRMSNRDEVAGICRDIENGILNSLSVGFTVLVDGEIEERKGKLPLVRVKSWRAHEASIVPLPADEKAKFRSLSHINNGPKTMDIEAFRTAFLERHAARSALDAAAIADEVITMLTAEVAPVVPAVVEPVAGARTAADTAAIATLRTAVAGRSAALVPTFDALAATGATVSELRGVLTSSLATSTTVSTQQTVAPGARTLKDIKFSDTSAGKLAG